MRDKTFAAAEIAGQITSESGKVVSVDYVYKAAHSIWPEAGNSLTGERFSFEFKTSFCDYCRIRHGKGGSLSFAQHLKSASKPFPARIGKPAVKQAPAAISPATGNSSLSPLESRILAYLKSKHPGEVRFGTMQADLKLPKSGMLGTPLRRLFVRGLVVPGSQFHWRLKGDDAKKPQPGLTHESVLAMMDNLKKEVLTMIDDKAAPAPAPMQIEAPRHDDRESDARIRMLEDFIVVFQRNHDISRETFLCLAEKLARSMHRDWSEPRPASEEFPSWLRKHKHLEAFLREMQGIGDSMHDMLERQPRFPL